VAARWNREWEGKTGGGITTCLDLSWLKKSQVPAAPEERSAMDAVANKGQGLTKSVQAGQDRTVLIQR